jgi:hypothetical protein
MLKRLCSTSDRTLNAVELKWQRITHKHGGESKRERTTVTVNRGKRLEREARTTEKAHPVPFIALTLRSSRRAGTLASF